METHTFTSICGRFQFTVKGDFIKKCDPNEFDVYDLMTKHQMASYLHNPAGPAIVHLHTGMTQYFVNGKQLNKEDAKKIEHSYKFNNKLMERIISDE